MVFVSPKIHSPVTTGFLKPRIFIPADLDSVLQTHELRYMFLHELQHCRRLDGLVNNLCIMFRIIYWFNPAVILVLKKSPWSGNLPAMPLCWLIYQQRITLFTELRF